MSNEERPLEGVLDDMKRGSGEGAVSIGDLLDHYQNRSLGLLLAFFGLVVVMPIIGDIPGAAILCATFVLISIAQTLAGRGTLWAPEFVRRFEISRDRFERGVEKARPWIRWSDRLLKRRLTILLEGGASRFAILVSAALLALSLYPLAFVPFGANAPGLGLLAFGLGLMARDGLFVLIGYVLLGAMAAALIVAL
ncbi:MAG: exopolysaccharide biosynthesis protein [Dichotomicrobium sp.]